MPRRGENRDIIIVATVTFFPLLTLKQKKEETFLLAIFFSFEGNGKGESLFSLHAQYKGEGGYSKWIGREAEAASDFPFPNDSGGGGGGESQLANADEEEKSIKSVSQPKCWRAFLLFLSLLLKREKIIDIKESH